MLQRPSRRVGRGLLAFGIAGIVLLVAAAILVLATVGSLASASAELGREQAALLRMVGPAGEALRSSATAARNAGASLQTSATSARDAADLTTQLAGSLDELSSLSQISFLGTQPFAQAGESFRSTAARSRTLSTNLASTASAIDANVHDADTVATQLDTLADQLDGLRSELATTPAPASTIALVGLEVILVGLLAWLAVPAVIAIRFGWEWARLAA